MNTGAFIETSLEATIKINEREKTSPQGSTQFGKEGTQYKNKNIHMEKITLKSMRVSSRYNIIIKLFREEFFEGILYNTNVNPSCLSSYAVKILTQNQIKSNFSQRY